MRRRRMSSSPSDASLCDLACASGGVTVIRTRLLGRVFNGAVATAAGTHDTRIIYTHNAESRSASVRARSARRAALGY